MSHEINPLNTDGVTEEVVRVHATRRVRQATEIAEMPAAPGMSRVLQKFGIGPEARSQREIRDDLARTNVEAIRLRNRTLLEMQKALDSKNLEEFRNRLATMHNAQIRAVWSLETAATLNALDELASQIDRSEDRVASIKSERVRQGVLDDIFKVFMRMRGKLQELLPAQSLE